jgi:hypothetical protein
MHLGDLVSIKRYHNREPLTGLVVGFNEAEDGGKEFVHILTEGRIQIFMHFDVEVIK